MYIVEEFAIDTFLILNEENLKELGFKMVARKILLMWIEQQKRCSISLTGSTSVLSGSVSLIAMPNNIILPVATTDVALTSVHVDQQPSPNTLV